MLTIGVDLAADVRKTAVASIQWDSGAASVSALTVGAGDSAIIDASVDAAAVGIDCPFGWPLEFVEFVVAHGRGEQRERLAEGADWRRRLAYRATDRFVRERTGRWPLSVSTDRLGLTAMRCSDLLDAFAARGEAIDRSGQGRIVEVYPAAGLRAWNVNTAGYKTSVEARAVAVEELRSAAPWLDVADSFADLMIRSDDAFDAVVAGLIARAKAVGQTQPVPATQVDNARAEGWIVLPDRDIARLAD